MREGLLNSVELTADHAFDGNFRTNVQTIEPNVVWYLNETIPVADLVAAQPFDEGTSNTDSHFIGLSALGGPGGSYTLTIMNPVPSDSGIYTARVQGILVDQNRCNATLQCDDIYIPMLAHTAITRPIAYEVKVQGM